MPFRGKRGGDKEISACGCLLLWMQQVLYELRRFPLFQGARNSMCVTGTELRSVVAEVLALSHMSVYLKREMVEEAFLECGLIILDLEFSFNSSLSLHIPKLFP